MRIQLRQKVVNIKKMEVEQLKNELEKWADDEEKTKEILRKINLLNKG